MRLFKSKKPEHKPLDHAPAGGIDMGTVSMVNGLLAGKNSDIDWWRQRYYHLFDEIEAVANDTSGNIHDLPDALRSILKRSKGQT